MPSRLIVIVTPRSFKWSLSSIVQHVFDLYYLVVRKLLEVTVCSISQAWQFQHDFELIMYSTFEFIQHLNFNIWIYSKFEFIQNLNLFNIWIYSTFEFIQHLNLFNIWIYSYIWIHSNILRLYITYFNIIKDNKFIYGRFYRFCVDMLYVVLEKTRYCHRCQPSRILACFPHSRIFARTSRISGFVRNNENSWKSH